MNQEVSFIDQLLADAETKDQKLIYSHYDLILMEISKLQQTITDNFSEAEQEIAIIKEWALQKNVRLQDRISFYEQKLEAFIRDENKKTIDLPHGVLKLHKKPAKIEVSDVEEFLKSATEELIRKIPEQIKPDLQKIKSFINVYRKIPAGVTFIEGKDEFTYKLSNNGKENINGTEETGT